jgi:hypothetical protein
MVTSDGPPGAWANVMADPVVMAAEARACRPMLTPERAMALIVENARLLGENAELRTRLRFLGVEGF